MKGEKTKWQKTLNTLNDYAGISTIGGLFYLQKNQSRISKIFWTFILLGFCVIIVYASIQSYTQWQQNQVFTTVFSMSYPLKKLPHPSVVICNDGNSALLLLSRFISVAQTLLKKYNNYTSQFSPYDSSKLMQTTPWSKLPQEFKTYIFNTNSSRINGTNLANKVFEHVFVSSDKMLVLDFSIMDIHEMLFAYSNPDSRVVLKVMQYHFKKNDDIIKCFLYPNSHCPSLGTGISVLEEFWDDSCRTSLLLIMLLFLPYSKLACFDILSQTENNLESSTFVNNCYYKGKKVACAAIFNWFPTDQQICCSFNMNFLESIFTSSVFSETLSQLNDYNKKNSKENSSCPGWYENEPISRSGRLSGLTFTLNGRSTSHLNLITNMRNYNSFQGYIGETNTFPLMNQKNFMIRKGFRNNVEVRGNIVEADPSVKNIDFRARRCLFEDEKKLQHFKNYTTTNCYFLCQLSIAKEMVKNYYNVSCSPWFFPKNPLDSLCLTNITLKLVNWIGKNLKQDSCSECLPTCNSIFYSQSVTYERLRECDDFSTGLSDLCDIKKSKKLYQPYLWTDSVLKQLKSTNLGNFTSKNLTSRFQQFQINYKQLGGATVFNNTYTKRDLFVSDVAFVSVYFSNPLTSKFIILPTSNIILYLSSLGGLAGLLLGLSLASLIEVLWLFLRMAKPFIKC